MIAVCHCCLSVGRHPSCALLFGLKPRHCPLTGLTFRRDAGQTGADRTPSNYAVRPFDSWPLFPGEFNRSTQHPSLERTDCWCRSNFSIKSQDIRHRSRSFERLRRYPPILAALPAISALCFQLRHEPCPCMSLHMHAIPTWRIRVKGCCVDRLSPPPERCRCDHNQPARQDVAVHNLQMRFLMKTRSKICFPYGNTS